MFKTFHTWAEFVKLSHTVFALPFALAAMVVAARDQRGWPGWKIFGLILAAMVCARTCAMSFNRIVDRKFDRENPRTASRHLPAGKVSLAGACLLCRWAMEDSAGRVSSPPSVMRLSMHWWPSLASIRVFELLVGNLFQKSWIR